MKKNWFIKLIVLMCLGLLTEVVSKIFNKIALNQRPSQAPFQTTNINKFEAQCFSLCSHNTKCYSFLIDQSNPEALKCLLYNTTIDYLQLGEKNNAEQSVFHSVQMRDCLDWYNIGARESGIYTIVISGGFSKRVACNMEVDGGGWLVFQYRHNGEVNFQKNWEEYKQGFGSLETEFWLGNDFLNLLTTQFEHEVYIQAEQFNGEIGFSKYSNFRVDNEEQKYRLHVSGLTGTHSLDDGVFFSTYDADNDNWSGVCSTHGTGLGGFWFSSYLGCGGFRPNAFYSNTGTVITGQGTIWIQLTSFYTITMKGFEMMVRRKP